jgi:peptide/nickel transport system substrate-binding protein
MRAFARRAAAPTLVLFAIATMHVIVSPPAVSAPSPRRGGTLVYAMSAEASTLDPAERGGNIAEAVKMLIYNGLVRETPGREIRPDLATAWRVDGAAWTLTLRQGVRFHDGTPFGAQSVKAHDDRLFASQTRRAADWRPYLDRVEVVDDNTVRFHTRFPDPFFLQRLADSSQIESPDAFRRYGRDLARNPVGTGPFRLRERISGARLVVVRNDEYWGEKAYLDQIVIRPVPEPGARAIALEAGDVQLADLLSPGETPRLGRNRNLDPIAGAIPPLASGFAQVESFDYNPGRARELLAQAGYASGFSATLVGTKGPYFKDTELVQVIQPQLKQIGVDVKIQTVEWSRYLELVAMPPDRSPLEMWLDGWSGERATEILQLRFGCDPFRPRGVNPHGYCNRDLDALVSEAARTLDDARRNSFLRLAQVLIRRDAPSIWGFATKSTIGMNRKLHGVLHFANETLTVDERAWLDP